MEALATTEPESRLSQTQSRTESAASKIISDADTLQGRHPLEPCVNAGHRFAKAIPDRSVPVRGLARTLFRYDLLEREGAARDPAKQPCWPPEQAVFLLKRDSANRALDRSPVSTSLGVPCRGGGTGRRSGLRSRRPRDVQVRFLSPAPFSSHPLGAMPTGWPF